MAFLLHSRPVILVAGAGMLFSGCAAWYIVGRRLSDRVVSLRHEVELLRQEVERLRSIVEQLLPPQPPRFEKNASFHNSSLMTSDDDDTYEDAYGG